VTATVTWWGHSTSTWRDTGTTVLFDPVLTARLGHLRRVRGPLPPARAALADLVLLSHLHADHTHLPSLRLVAGPADVVGAAGGGRRRPPPPPPPAGSSPPLPSTD
jgi:L-ascorbate metabolism protein UlaG (beta-lactamase superfamily)